MTDRDPTVGDEFDPRTALGLIEAEGARVRQALDVTLWLQLLAWGVAWTVGFGGLWLDVRGQHPYLGPGWWSGPLFASLLVVAGIVTAVTVSRGTRGVGGRAERVGRTVGLGWGLGFGGFLALTAALARAGMSPEAAGVAYGAGALLITGLMYVLCGAVWDDRLQARLGGWLIVVAVGSAWAGPVALPLVAAAFGGGGLLVAAGLAWRRSHRG